MADKKKPVFGAKGAPVPPEAAAAARALGKDPAALLAWAVRPDGSVSLVLGSGQKRLVTAADLKPAAARARTGAEGGR